MRKLGLGVVLPGLLIFSLSCDSPTESRSNPYEQQPIDWPSLADSPWPMYRHDPQFTGRSNFIGPQNGKINWNISIPGIQTRIAFTSFAIGADLTIYFGHSVDGETLKWRFYAIKPDGTIKWNFSENEGDCYITTGPLVTKEERIIFGASSYRANGYIYMLDKSGHMVWRYATESKIYIAGINIDKEGNLYFSDKDGSIYSLDSNGNLRWKIQNDDIFKAHNCNGMPISPDGQTIYVTNVNPNGSTLYAFSKEGNIKWSFSCGDSAAIICTTPIVDCQNNIYFTIGYSKNKSSINGIYSLNPEGILRWKMLSETFSLSEMTIDTHGNIYTYIDRIYSLKNNGEIRFVIETDGLITAPLISSNNNIYAISNILYCFSNNGVIFFQVDLPCEIFADGAIDNQGNLFLGAPCEENSLIKVN